MHTFIVILLLYIAAMDVKTFRIANGSLCLLTLLLAIENGEMAASDEFFLALLISTFAFVLKVGMGDIKLFLILALFTPRIISSFEYLYGVCLVAIATALVFWFQKRGRRIPFAPALIAPYLALNLAI